MNRDPLPLSLLNDLLYCRRRAALKVIEGWREGNEHTARGDIVHEHSDLAGYEVVKGVTLLRALPVFSARLGLNGKCDIVERHPDGSLCPVEFKLGKRRAWVNDEVQLCAQALCLEEMFGRPVTAGAVFHAQTKRRRPVGFTAQLRQFTEAGIVQLHQLLDPQPPASNPQLPAAVFRPACEECSLFDLCLPKATGDDGRARQLSRQLFQTS